MMEPEAGGAPNAQTGATRKTTVIEAHYRIVTPMFCSGADQQKAELRLSSFKGALRFWWRTLMWGQVEDVKELWEREAALFGSSDQKYGQSKVRLQFLETKLDGFMEARKIFHKGSLEGSHYLGYGLMHPFESKDRDKNEIKHRKGELMRPMIEGGSFKVRCRVSGAVSQEDIDSVKNALVLLGTVGGLGSRSRRGFGSLTLTALTQNSENGTQVAKTLEEDPIKRLKAVLVATKRSNELPEWTAWSTQAKIIRTTISNNKDPLKIHDSLGREFVHFRSWGKNGTVLEKDREGNFANDHDLFKWSKGDSNYPDPPRIQVPKRVAFGLPHNYGKEPHEHVTLDNKKMDRRGSPLFFHIHQIDENSEAVGLVFFLPARFLVTNDTKVKVFGEERCLDWSTSSFWEPITDFLDRLTGKKGAKTKKTSISGEEESLV